MKPTHCTAALAAFLACSAISFPTSPAVADPASSHGRLPDGRAYRIDHDGMQLVDYIADLEVTNDDLKRQVGVLEDELDEKDKRCGTAPQPKKPVGETTLLGGPAASAHLPSATGSDTQCQARLQPLSSRIAELEATLAASRGAVPPPPAVRTEVRACDYQSPENPLWTKVHQLESQLSGRPSSDSLTAERAAREDREVELERVRAQLKTSGAELTAKNDELEDARHDLEKAKQALADRSESSARAALNSEPAPSQKKTAAAAGTGGHGLSDSNDVRKELRDRLAKVQELIIQRKNLIDSTKEHSRGVSIGIQPLVSKHGESLDSLRVLATKASTEEDAERVRTGVADIETVLKEDIQLLTRLSHGR